MSVTPSLARMIVSCLAFVSSPLFGCLSLIRYRCWNRHIGQYSTVLAWYPAVAALLTLIKQPLVIAYSVLIALGAFGGALPLQVNLLLTKFVGTNYGFGWHKADLWPDLALEYSKVRTFQSCFDITDFQNKWNYVSSYVYLVTLFGYKFTILLLYLRIFWVNDMFRYCTWAVMAFVFSYVCSNILTQIVGCIPIHLYWQNVTGHCIDRLKAGVVFGSMNIISDLFIFILPMPMVWRLQLSRKEKLGVTLVFMGGGM